MFKPIIKGCKSGFSVIKEHNFSGVGIFFSMILVVILVAALTFGMYCLNGLFIWLIWNYVVVPLFSLNLTFTFWQCVGISVLISFIQSIIKGFFPSKE